MLSPHRFHSNHINRWNLWGFAVLLAGCCALSTPVLAQNLIQNGDFELPPFAPSSNLTNWVVGGTGHVHSIDEGATSETHSAALSVGFDSEGTTLSQSFPTVVGQSYTVDFDAGIFGQPTGNPLQLNVQVNGNNPLINQTLTPPLIPTFTPAAVFFTHYQYTFTADSSTTTLQFMDIGLGNESADILVDTVLVRPNENLLANGDFETAPFDTPGTVTSWTVTGAVADRGSQGSAGGTHAAAFNPGGNSSGNILSQTFSTVSGKTYTLEFFAGVYGYPDNNATLQQLDLQVIGSNPILSQTLTPPVQATNDPNFVKFQHYQFTFVANSASTTLRFTDIGTGNSIADIMLDTVSVTPESLELLNGDFELAPFDTFMITGWTISGNGRIESKAEGSTTPTHAAAFSTGGSSQGNILSQALSTIPGRQYTLDFDSGVFGRRTGAPLQINVQLLGNGAVLNQTITPSDAFTFTVSQVTFQHYHYVFTANSGSTTLRFQDIGTGNSAADSLIDTVSVQLMPPPTFTNWQSQKFTPAQINDPMICDWSSDPDKDGIRNGFEYFFFTEPLPGIKTIEPPKLPQVSIITSGNSRYFALTYRRPIGYSGTPENVGVSDNLGTWDETGSQVEVVSGPTLTGDGVTETLTVRLKTPINQGPIPKKFFRFELAH